jgi:lysozyme
MRESVSWTHFLTLAREGFARMEARRCMISFDYSSVGLALTRRFEGFRAEAYQDSAGVWTIGYGHTGPEVREGQRISEFEAEALLRTDLAAAVVCIRRAVRVEITQAQFDALADFCFNVGRGNFLNSSLLRYVNREEFGSVFVQFGLWIHADGKVVPGLVRRRVAEAALFAGQGFPARAQDGASAADVHTTKVAAEEPGSVLPRSVGKQVA